MSFWHHPFRMFCYRLHCVSILWKLQFLNLTPSISLQHRHFLSCLLPSEFMVYNNSLNFHQDCPPRSLKGCGGKIPVSGTRRSLCRSKPPLGRQTLSWYQSWNQKFYQTMKNVFHRPSAEPAWLPHLQNGRWFPAIGFKTLDCPLFGKKICDFSRHRLKISQIWMNRAEDLKNLEILQNSATGTVYVPLFC